MFKDLIVDINAPKPKKEEEAPKEAPKKSEEVVIEEGDQFSFFPPPVDLND